MRQTKISRPAWVSGEVLSLCLVVALSARAQAPSSATAGDSKKECVANYEQAQVLRNSGNLLESLESLVVCSQQTCHPAVRSDCVQWYEEVKTAIPSVVISARSPDKDEFDVRVFIDGKLVAKYLDGRPLELNPGSHKFRFETAKYPPEERQLLIVPGEKLRAIAVSFRAPEGGGRPLPAAASDAPPPVPALQGPGTPTPTPAAVDKPSRPIPPLSYVFGAVALAGVASFAGFGLWALDERDSLDSTCRPVCEGSKVDGVRTKLIVADASLGLAVASAVTATIFYINRPWIDAGPARTPRQSGANGAKRDSWLPDFDVDPLRRTASFGVRGAF